MKAVVITFPGSNCDRDLAVALEQAGARVTRVWHKEDALPEGTDLVGVPGGFSFGDYLRCGAIAAHSPIAGALRRHAERGGRLLGARDEAGQLGELFGGEPATGPFAALAAAKFAKVLRQLGEAEPAGQPLAALDPPVGADQ